ncbi:MAG: enoyl-CoA hydratase/isomerase family protein, partial [Rhodococcus sp. (in: high G+C Gram-positive bacteria)]|uniref:enoyl-CoA hydratase/isomerase family protein n=1 Tax=Rhodococcus sp. TaxID=1831 RepID=UPI003BB1F90D
MTTDSQQTTTEDEVLVDFDEHVLTVTINRPRARNAINENVCRLVGSALERAEEDRDVRVVVLTAAGDLAFSAGADLKALAGGVPVVPEGEPWQRWGLAGVVGHYISKPIIAAVNGAALGGGAEIALACDLIVAARSASFGLP